MATVSAWTDGSAATQDPQSGGWGVVILTDVWPFPVKISGYELHTTSQRMEMTAMLKALEFFSRQGRHEYIIHTDSAYLMNCFVEGWMNKWFKNGWLTSKGEPVKNKDLWIALDLAARHAASVSFVKIKGHSGDPNNEAADRLADAARRKGLDLYRRPR